MEKYIGILMADLSGYTALTEVHGGEAAVKIIDRYVQIAKQSLRGKSKLIERAGDQLVIISDVADDLAKTAISLEQNTQSEPFFLSIHAGLHFGPVIEHNGHFFGSTINLAARIASKAKRNKVLCSQDFVNAMINPEAFKIVPQGKIKFKNITESKEVFELLPLATAENTRYHIDPVCHMHLNENELTISLLEGEEEYFFCSEDCKKIFLSEFSQLSTLVT